MVSWYPFIAIGTLTKKTGYRKEAATIHERTEDLSSDLSHYRDCVSSWCDFAGFLQRRQTILGTWYRRTESYSIKPLGTLIGLLKNSIVHTDQTQNDLGRTSISQRYKCHCRDRPPEVPHIKNYWCGPLCSSLLGFKWFLYPSMSYFILYFFIENNVFIQFLPTIVSPPLYYLL